MTAPPDSVAVVAAAFLYPLAMALLLAAHYVHTDERNKHFAVTHTHMHERRHFPQPVVRFQLRPHYASSSKQRTILPKHDTPRSRNDIEKAAKRTPGTSASGRRL